MTEIGAPVLHRRVAMLFLAGLAFPLHGTFGADLPMPGDKTILTVSGKIRNTNKDGQADFDRFMLEAIDQSSFETTTPWFDHAITFQGVAMERLMQAVGAFGDRAVVTALNDYRTEIPVADFARYDVLLALKRDGAYMSVRDKGPLFIIYPFDAHPELRSSTYTGRCAWQVRQIMFT